MPVTDDEKASSIRRNVRTSSLGFVSALSFRVRHLVAHLYNQRVSLSRPPNRSMLSMAAKKIDQKCIVLADLCGNSSFESAAKKPVSVAGFVESDAIGSEA